MRGAVSCQLSAISLLLVLLWPAGGRADTYARERRVTHIERGLALLAETPADARQALVDELGLGARTDCRASFGTPTVGCLLEMARATCGRRSQAERATCTVLADLIITNSLAERELVDDKRRVELMNSGDYRGAMASELRRRYALLAGAMTLSAGYDRRALAGSIDRYCAERGRVRRLAYQRCVAAIVWYIGTAEQRSNP